LGEIEVDAAAPLHAHAELPSPARAASEANPPTPANAVFCQALLDIVIAISSG